MSCFSSSESLLKGPLYQLAAEYFVFLLAKHALLNLKRKKKSNDDSFSPHVQVLSGNFDEFSYKFMMKFNFSPIRANQMTFGCSKNECKSLLGF